MSLDQRALDARFEERFGRTPTLVVRAPGRVNLIGEHIDYCGLPVFPMALSRAVRMRAAPRLDHRVHVLNGDPRFEDSEFSLGAVIAPGPPGAWDNYVKAAAQELAVHVGATRGFDAIVTSDVPVAMGLSSSSAMVVASGLTINAANGVGLPKSVMAEAMARAEQYVGTHGGGMDQAISLGAVEGTASRIEFDPLVLTPVPVPSGWHFVVASSLVTAEKSGGAQAAYNRRTSEVWEALELMWTALESDQEDTPATYRGLLEETPLADLVRTGERVLPAQLLPRFRHVVTEAARVNEAVGAMGREDLESFGALMNASHESLRADYQVSSDELDELVRLALAGGASGARLTGAGFGGCIVALVRASQSGDLIHSLGRSYYQPRGLEPGEGDHLFVARPGPGASVRVLT